MKQITSEDLYLNRAKYVMKFLGVWIPPDAETILQRFSKIFMLSLQYLLLIFQSIYIVQVWGDLEAVSNASYVLFTQACLCFKVTLFHMQINILKELLIQMNSDIFKPENKEHERILKVHSSKIKRLLLGFMISSQITCGLWALKPLLDDAGYRKFPLDMWMPLKPQSMVQYVLGYIFQLLSICTSAYIYFGVDSVALSMVIFGCAQIDIIKDKIVNVKPVIMKNPVDRMRILDENYNLLIKCVTQHQAVVSFTKQVEDAYHTYICFQLSGGVGLICMSALRILVIEWGSMQFLSILVYVVVMTSQLFVCCWCGHELTSTCEELQGVMYLCPWYEQDIKFKKAFCFAMMSASRPVVFRAGGYIALSRQTFVAILRMSYSYIAVLNQTRNH